MQIRFKAAWRIKQKTASWWLLGCLGFFRDPAENRVTVALRVRTFLQVMAIAMVVMYFAGGLSLYVWLKRNPYNAVRLGDLLLPTHWPQLRARRGQTYIAEGLQDLKVNHLSEGIFKLKEGVRRFPADMEGRMALAQIYVRLGNNLEAITLLKPALTLATPSQAYLEFLFEIANQSEDYTLIIETVLDLKARSAVPAKSERWLEGYLIRAQLDAHREQEALATLDGIPGLLNDDFKEFKALALLKSQQPVEAIASLLRWRQEYPGEERPVRLLVRIYREVGDYAKMEQTLKELLSLSSNQAQARTYETVQDWLAGRPDQAERALVRFLDLYGTQPDFIVQAAHAFATLPSSQLIRICIRESIGIAQAPLLFCLAQAQATEGNYNDAIKTYALLLERLRNKADKTLSPFLVTWLGLVIDASRGDTYAGKII